MQCAIPQTGSVGNVSVFNQIYSHRHQTILYMKLLFVNTLPSLPFTRGCYRWHCTAILYHHNLAGRPSEIGNAAATSNFHDAWEVLARSFAPMV